MRHFARIISTLAGAILFFLAGSALGDDAFSSSRYAGLPNLTDDQKAKISAIEKQADEQVMGILTDDQRAALAKPAGGGAAGHGLYAGEAAAQKSGPIKSRDYWESKFNAEQLELAIKSHQPEGAIGLQLISQIHLLDDLLKDHPNHTEVLGWKARAVAVQKQIGDNFNRSDSFKPGCLWNQDSYMQAYVGYNTAKTAMDDNDQELAFSMSGLALSKVNILTDGDESRMADYPAEAKEFIHKIKPELQEIHEKAGKATHHL